MTDDRANNPHHQPQNENAENGDRIEQFNELSELSLEERMAVADQIGIPVRNAGEAAATGTMSGRDDTAGNSTDGMEEHTGEEADR